MKCKGCQGQFPYLSPDRLCGHCEAKKCRMLLVGRLLYGFPDGISYGFDRQGSPDRENADKLLSALRELGAIDETSLRKKGEMRAKTGLTEREYRDAIHLLQAENAVKTKPGAKGGTWLVS